jgi:hypothetical protein
MASSASAGHLERTSLWAHVVVHDVGEGRTSDHDPPELTEGGEIANPRTRADHDTRRGDEIRRGEVEHLLPLGGRRQFTQRQISSAEMSRHEVAERHRHHADRRQAEPLGELASKLPLEPTGRRRWHAFPETGSREERRCDRQRPIVCRRELP